MYGVHKLVLSTCSNYFDDILRQTNCKNPTILFQDIQCEDLEAILDYMYLGKVDVKQSNLATVLKAAKCLKIKGLSIPDEEIEKPVVDKMDDSFEYPSTKRKRRNEYKKEDHITSPSKFSPEVKTLYSGRSLEHKSLGKSTGNQFFRSSKTNANMIGEAKSLKSCIRNTGFPTNIDDVRESSGSFGRQQESKTLKSICDKSSSQKNLDGVLEEEVEDIMIIDADEITKGYSGQDEFPRYHINNVEGSTIPVRINVF